MNPIKTKFYYFKLVICLTFILSNINISNAQGPYGITVLNTEKYTVLDSANFRFTYELTFVSDTSKPNTTQTNQLILLVGNKFSKFFPEHPSMKTEKKSKHADGSPMTSGSGLAGTEIFKNFNTRKETITTILFGSTNVYIYEENMPDIKWSILPDKKEIYSYQCQKATTTFLGRTYEAWFTTEIPINNGPWKFGNLPGFILLVEDIQKHYIFNCTEIQPLQKKEAIVKYDWKYVPISKKELNQLIKRMFGNITQVMESTGKTIASGSNRNISIPYNPLEKE